jgi:hypothetical protein
LANYTTHAQFGASLKYFWLNSYKVSRYDCINPAGGAGMPLFHPKKIAAKPQKSAIFSKFRGQNRAIFIIFAVFGPKTRFLDTAHKPHKIVATYNHQRKTNRTKNHRHPTTKPHTNKKQN